MAWYVPFLWLVPNKSKLVWAYYSFGRCYAILYHDSDLEMKTFCLNISITCLDVEQCCAIWWGKIFYLKKKKSQLRVSLVSRWYRLGAAIHFVRSNLQTVLQLRLFAQRACRQAHSRGHASPPTWTGVSVINSPKIHFSKLVIEPCDLSLKINTVALRGFSRRPALPFCFYWERWTGRKDLLCFVCMQMTGAPLGYCRERH